MKKIMTIIGCFVLISLLTGCGNSQYIKPINYSELKEKMEQNESFILEVMSTTCSACEDFKPKLESVVNEYKVTVYQLNTHDMSDEDWEEFSTTYSVTSTPTTMFITEGKEISVATRIDGSVSKDKIISKMKAMDYIK